MRKIIHEQGSHLYRVGVILVFLFFENGKRIRKTILQLDSLEEDQSCIHRRAHGDRRRTVRDMPEKPGRDRASYQTVDTCEHIGCEH